MAYNAFYNFEDPGTSPPPRNDAIRHRKHGTPEDEHALRDLMDNMYEISDDPSGSDPALYLPPEDAEVCRRVAALADHLDWPNANELGRMRVSRDPEIFPAWKKRNHIARQGLTKALFFPETGEEHQGYVLGVLGASPDQLVALCDDGQLRSLRADELERSKAFGWGSLPDPDKLNAALDIGRMQEVEYMNVSSNPKSKTLAGKLLENVPGELLDSNTLEHFGLKGYKKLHSSDLVRENSAVPA